MLRTDARIADALSDALLAQGAQSSVWKMPTPVLPRRCRCTANPACGSRAHGRRAWSRRCARRVRIPRLSSLPPARKSAWRRCLNTGPSLWGRDWVRLSQSQFEPIRISDRLWIVPSWSAAPDPHALNLVLDPGLAFGTGSHPTTRLCLQWLERMIRGGERVLDYGCGSGILAIAALRLGAREALGVDVDPQALVAARTKRRAQSGRCPFCQHGDGY